MWRRLWEVPVMGFSSHQQMHAGPSGRIVECSHFSRQHYGGRSAPRRRHIRRRSSEAGQREHMVWQGITGGSDGLSFCVLVATSPHRARLGGVPRARDARLGRHPSPLDHLELAPQKHSRRGPRSDLKGVYCFMIPLARHRGGGVASGPRTTTPM
jgi:hypothetical protein